MNTRLTAVLKIFGLFILISLYTLLSTDSLYIDVINPDGINWHTRTLEFTQALSDGKYSNTYQVYHPGTTLMWVSGPLLNIFRNNVNVGATADESKYTFLERDYYAKLSLVIFCTIIFSLCLLVLWKVAGFNYMVVFGLLMSLEPFVIGVRRLYHLDYLMTAPLFLCLLLLVYYNYRTPKLFLPVSAGLFFALAILTKSTAVMFLPLVPFIFLLGNFRVLNKILGFLIFLLASVFFIYILFPPIWKNPVKKVPKYFEKISVGVSIIGLEGKEELGSSGKSDNIVIEERVEERDSNFYIASLFMRLSPAGGVLIVISTGLFIYLLLKVVIVGIWRSLKLKRLPNSFNFSAPSWISFWSLGFSLAVLGALTISAKKSDRYEILIFPFLFTLVAHSISKLRAYYYFPVLFIYILLSFIELGSYRPYYMAYSNTYLGGLETRLATLDSAPFGIGIYRAFEVVKEDLAKNGNSGYYTIAGSKAIKAISAGGKFSRNPSCVTDYQVLYVSEESPIYLCVNKYALIDTVKIGGYDYWNIYRRLNQRHESNGD